MKSHSDHQLVGAAQADPQQFAVLYKLYYQTIYNYFWYRVGHHKDLAEDLAQDTFVRAFQNLYRFRCESASYLTYLLKIAHNLLRDHWRKQPVSLVDDADQFPAEVGDDHELSDLLRRLWQAIQKLSATERDILYLRYRRGYRIQEVAAIVGKSENAVKLVLSRARQKLRGEPSVQLLEHFAEQPRRAPRCARYQTTRDQ